MRALSFEWDEFSFAPRTLMAETSCTASFHAAMQLVSGEEKAALNQAKHGVSFLRAAAAFANEIIEKVDSREDYGELRLVALGRVDADVYRVVYTWRGDNLVRLISAQKANRHEREAYYRQVFV